MGWMEDLASGLQAAGEWTFGKNSALGQAADWVAGDKSLLGQAIRSNPLNVANVLQNPFVSMGSQLAANELGVGAAPGTAATAENARLNQIEAEAKRALEMAERQMSAADEQQRAALELFVTQQRELIDRVAAQKKELAGKLARSQADYLENQRGLLAGGYIGAGEELKGQEARLADILRLQEEGVKAREALTADEEAAARRITAPGGLLERQRQSNALAQARALQKARLGGPAARAAVMGQFATQGAELGMQAQRDIMAAQDRARQARAGLLGERTAAQVAQQQGLSALSGKRSELGLSQAQTMAGLMGRMGETEANRLASLYGADVGKLEDYRRVGEQAYRTEADRSKATGERRAGLYAGLGEASVGRLAAESEAEARRRREGMEFIGNLLGTGARALAAGGGA